MLVCGLFEVFYSHDGLRPIREKELQARESDKEKSKFSCFFAVHAILFRLWWIRCCDASLPSTTRFLKAWQSCTLIMYAMYPGRYRDSVTCVCVCVCVCVFVCMPEYVVWCVCGKKMNEKRPKSRDSLARKSHFIAVWCRPGWIVAVNSSALQAVEWCNPSTSCYGFCRSIAIIASGDGRPMVQWCLFVSLCVCVCVFARVCVYTRRVLRRIYAHLL